MRTARCLGFTLVSLVLMIVPLPSAASADAGFGVSSFTVQTTVAHETPEETEGKLFRDVYEASPVTQAGGHPYALTSTIELNSETTGEGLEQTTTPIGGDPKDVAVELPPGLLANPLAVPRCPLRIFTRSGNNCPAAAQVGIIELALASSTLIEPIYDLVPEAGQSAEFGIPVGGSFNLVLTAHLVHTPGGYGFTVVSNNIAERGFTRFKVTFWGVPADPSHDPQRGRRCESSYPNQPPSCPANGLDDPGGEKAGVAPVPFLVMPTDCTADVISDSVRVSVDSWETPGVYREGPSAPLARPTGCSALSFAPGIEVSPDSTLADSPVGLAVNLQVPQTDEPQPPRTPDLRDAVVTLPPGLSINPGVVDGVQACDETGPTGINLSGPESEMLGPDGEPQLAPGHCPDASIVGSAEAITPLLPEPVKGHLYLARPLCGAVGQPACTEEDARDGRLYRLYLELGGAGALANTGINIKAAGVVSANLATGQLSSSFTENPQAPFSELRLRLNGGPRAPLANPRACGEARTTADLTPWSATGRTPDGLFVLGTADANPFSYYEVTGCANPPGLRPGFLAGTTTPQAGAYSPFTLNLTRGDGEQELAGLQVHTPPGLLGMLSSVPLCGEPAAAQGTCPQGARIGSTTVASGAGSHPFEIGGSVYLTTGYEGAPFGLSIVTDAVAGPFNLGLVVVRARIDVDPESSALTITSDPLPQIVFGVPLRLQRIAVDIDRPQFMFNPTNCAAQQITAGVSGSENATTAVSSPFAVTGCRSLGFKPQFKVSTSASASRANGASLDAKVTYPAAAPGSEANIARVKVELPKQLPSRLTTLQKACPAAVFANNPASCPAQSVVGIARASTPVLPSTLSGPVYFVSHGGEAFPSLTVVLQGEGVRVDLTGTTFISRQGITSSTFKSVPDVPVGSFELFLPQGPYSALAANGNLCRVTRTILARRKVARRVGGRIVHRTVRTRERIAASLQMPSEFVAQNGAVVRQTTNIQVTGCAAHARTSRRTHTQAPGPRAHALRAANQGRNVR